MAHQTDFFSSADSFASAEFLVHVLTLNGQAALADCLCSQNSRRESRLASEPQNTSVLAKEVDSQLITQSPEQSLASTPLLTASGGLRPSQKHSGPVAEAVQGPRCSNTFLTAWQAPDNLTLTWHTSAANPISIIKKPHHTTPRHATGGFLPR